MKHLNSPQEKANWENNLLNDLAFIKQHRRYPMSKRTIAPAALVGFALLAVLRMLWPLIFITTSDGLAKQPPVLQWILILSTVLVAAIVLFQAFRVLKFDKLATSYYIHENIALLKKFFTANHLAYTQHPEAAEVFMIVSRNLGANAKNDYREIMVFIADDKQILVNSHFTGKKFNITPPSRNYKRMSKELQRWLNGHINSSDSSNVPVKTF
jgi:ABC-type multidrug transport system fused ATPase/permease subunit